MKQSQLQEKPSSRQAYFEHLMHRDCTGRAAVSQAMEAASLRLNAPRNVRGPKYWVSNYVVSPRSACEAIGRNS
jgi:hypothetical protein